MRLDKETFPFLVELDLANGWNNITQADLQEYLEEQKTFGMTPKDIPNVFQAIENLNTFVALASDKGEQPESVLSALVKEGIFEYVKGGEIYRNDESLSLVIGRTGYPVGLKDGKLKVGKLVGTISVFEDIDSLGKVRKDDNGNPIVKAVAKLREPKKDDAVVFEIPFKIDYECESSTGERIVISEGRLLNAVEEGLIHRYLKHKPVPGEGGSINFVDMRCLPVGQYLVTDISEPRENDYKGKVIKSWNLTVDGVGVVGSRGKDLENHLETSWKSLQKRAQKVGITLDVAWHVVTYKTDAGLLENRPFLPDFLNDLQTGKVLGLKPGKIGGEDVKHGMKVSFNVNDKPYNNEKVVGTAANIHAALGGSSTPALGGSSATVDVKVAPVGGGSDPNLDDVPFARYQDIPGFI